jgi:peptide/nickel transport system substrate-binding protein/oligopeptide transport system substrate-binding protein
MRRTKRLASFAVPVAAALVLASCGGGSSDKSSGSGDSGGSGATGGSFSISSAEPEAFAPTSACYSSDCSSIINQVFTGLLSVDPKTTKQQLHAAESINSEDGAKWTIKLKPGFKFSNGEPADAEAFVRAWNYTAYAPNATQLGFFFSKVKGYDDLQGKKPKAKEMSGLKAVDANTIEVQLSKPFSQWPLVMSYTPAFAPMAKACLQDIKACNEKPIGNGPYEFADKWQHNQSITLKKVADYPDKANAGNADEITYKIYGDLKTAYRDFQSGELDIVEQVDSTQQEQAQAQYPDQILQVDSGSYSYLGFPFYVKDFENVDVRKALSMAIDRDTIIDRVFNGTYLPATDVIPGFVPGSRDDACDACKYDPEQAKKLYDAAGGPKQLTIWFNNDGGHEQWTQAVAQGWKKDLGIDVKFKSMPFTPFLNTLGTRKDVDGPYRLGWLPDYPSPENYLDPIYGAGSSNYGDWKGPEHDKFLKLIDEGNSASSVEQGLPKYQEAADVVLDNMVVIPLWFGKTFLLHSTRVDNVSYSPTDQTLLKQVTVTG